MRITLVTMILGLASTAIAGTKDLPTKSTAIETICGDEDNRVITEKPFAARMLKSKTGTAPCSATLLGNSCMVSAGHCSAYLFVAEFNTPVSVNSAIVHSKPEDQYIIDQSTKKVVNGGMGNDWAVFKVLPNELTGLTAEESQGGFVEVSFEEAVEESEIMIAGYGTDTESNTNFAQQTSYGYLKSNGSIDSALNYNSDTTGGNSGSGVIDNETQKLIGVHTHGGCSRSSSSSNTGTALAFSPKFLQALKDCLETK
jgi:V8-like Glu-specific endopeptidase